MLKKKTRKPKPEKHASFGRKVATEEKDIKNFKGLGTVLEKRAARPDLMKRREKIDLVSIV